MYQRGLRRLPTGQRQSGFVHTGPETVTIQIIETGSRPAVNLRQGNRIVMAPELDVEEAVVQTDIADCFQGLPSQ